MPLGELPKFSINAFCVVLITSLTFLCISKTLCLLLYSSILSHFYLYHISPLFDVSLFFISACIILYWSLFCFLKFLRSSISFRISSVIHLYFLSYSPFLKCYLLNTLTRAFVILFHRVFILSSLLLVLVHNLFCN